MNTVDFRPGSTASGAGGQPPRRPSGPPPPQTPSKASRRSSREKLPCQRCLRALRAGRGCLTGQRVACDTRAAEGYTRCDRCERSNRAGPKGYVPVPLSCVAAANRLLARNQMIVDGDPDAPAIAAVQDEASALSRRMQNASKASARRNLASGSGASAASPSAAAPTDRTANILGGILEALRFMAEAYAVVNQLNPPVWFDEADSGRGSDLDPLSDPPESDDDE
ncbi:hypothetical protein CLAIMM_15020 [Cladophialophora immunda]|nr:hypothetical protein CLAIMM_15020 [Cladophialophora immunda]